MTNRHWVRSGRTARLGVVSDPTGIDARAGDLWIVRTSLGLEIGEILAAASRSESVPTVEFIRQATFQDLQQQEANSAESLRWLQLAQHFAEQSRFPLLFIDSEVSLDRGVVWFYVLRWQDCDMRPLIVDLRSQVPIPFELVDVARPLRMESRCGSCGSSGCGSCTCSKSTKGCALSGCGRCSCSSAVASTKTPPIPVDAGTSPQRISIL